MISIIDYGLGNIKAFANIYKRLNIECEIIRSAQQLTHASKIILPGVGSFDHAMQLLNNSGLRETLDNMVLHKKVPVLGICVGMQMLAHSSDEGKEKGLSWIDGEVKKIDISKLQQSTLLPHMGWNDIEPKENPLFTDLYIKAKFYFLHSYYFVCNNNVNSIATCTYGNTFTCAVNNENIYGVQFHPEKSHQYGIQLLKNFAIL